MFLGLIQFTAFAILFYLVFLVVAWPIRNLVGSIKSLIRGSNRYK